MGENSLAPTLLLAMPQMQDPNFARSVVLLCRHAPEGAMGLVVNRRTDQRAHRDNPIGVFFTENFAVAPRHCNQITAHHRQFNRNFFA